jgi:hypothetical protein
VIAALLAARGSFGWHAPGDLSAWLLRAAGVTVVALDAVGVRDRSFVLE